MQSELPRSSEVVGAARRAWDEHSKARLKKKKNILRPVLARDAGGAFMVSERTEGGCLSSCFRHHLKKRAGHLFTTLCKPWKVCALFYIGLLKYGLRCHPGFDDAVTSNQKTGIACYHGTKGSCKQLEYYLITSKCAEFRDPSLCNVKGNMTTMYTKTTTIVQDFVTNMVLDASALQKKS